MKRGWRNSKILIIYSFVFFRILHSEMKLSVCIELLIKHEFAGISIIYSLLWLQSPFLQKSLITLMCSFIETRSSHGKLLWCNRRRMPRILWFYKKCIMSITWAPFPLYGIPITAVSIDTLGTFIFFYAVRFPFFFEYVLFKCSAQFWPVVLF